MSSTLSECQYAQQLVQTYFRILTIGCERRGQSSSPVASASEERCSNTYCRSSASSNSSVSPTDAAILSVYLATQAPIPLCMPIVSYFPLPQQADDNIKEEEVNEDRPETDDGDGQEEQAATDSMAHLLGSTPRRRLSSAVELDLTFNNLKTTTSSSHLAAPARYPIEEEQEDEDAEHRDRVSRSSLGDRKLSLPKQKLLEALKKSFPGIAHGRTLGINLDNRKAGR